MQQIRGKLALVTGAASGIGRAIALALAGEGADLVLVDIDRQRLDATAEAARRQGVAAAARTVDLAEPEQIRRLVEPLLDDGPRLDILVNNAGIAYYGATDLMSEDLWERLLAVNLHAPLRLTRALLPTLLARPEAHILNVCSIAGLVATRRLAAYHASKFALVGFSESLRAEYGPRGLGVTALCPGLVRTDLFRTAETEPDKSLPRIPRWLTTSADRVAARAIRAIRRKEGTVLVTPLAHFLWGFKRLAPGLLDWLQQFRRHRPPTPSPTSSAAAPWRTREAPGSSGG
jgi:short-subunit dehydrogenase